MIYFWQLSHGVDWKIKTEHLTENYNILLINKLVKWDVDDTEFPVWPHQSLMIGSVKNISKKTILLQLFKKYTPVINKN